MPDERDFDHPSDLLFHPNKALKGLSSLFGMAPPNCQMNEVMAEEFACLLDVLAESFERRTKWAEEAYDEVKSKKVSARAQSCILSAHHRQNGGAGT